MSNTINNKCFDFTMPVSVPDSVDEFDKQAGKPGAALGEAIRNVIYRSWNSDFRKAFLQRMETESKIAWPIDEKATAAKPDPKDKSAEKTPVYIADGDYYKLLKASGFTVEQMLPIALDVAKTIEFDPSPGERGQGKVGKEYIAAAEDLLKDPAFTRKLAKLEALNPGLKVELDDEKEPGVKPSVNTLARAVKVNADRKLREQMAELGDDDTAEG